MGTNRIVYAGQTFDDQEADNLLSGNCFIENSLACDELNTDTLDATVDCSAEVPTIFAPADADGMLTINDKLFGVRPYLRLLVHDLSTFVYGDPVYYYRDNVLFSKFYMASTKEVGSAGAYIYEITCTSAIGLLDNSIHYGGMYTGQPMVDVLSDIVGGMVEYTLDQEFSGIAVYGWLPIATRRENLHQLLFAEGCSVKKSADGTLHFTKLTDSSPSEIGNDRMFLGVDVDYGSPATKVSISEHAYTAYSTDKNATLFEGEVMSERLISPNGAELSGTLVRFDGPMHDLTIENGTILERSVNYAVIGPSSNCKLSGKEYTHTIRVVSKPDSVTRSLVSLKDNEVTVTDATLVSLANSENVANRVMAYYGHIKIADVDLVVQDERPGDPVVFEAAYRNRKNGFLQSMDITMSGILRASTTLVSGYIPGDIGNYYQHSVLLTAGTTWTVPPECKGKIRVVLIGGGHGGDVGENGKDGAANGGAAGAGGLGGTAGAGGRIFQIVLLAAPGQSFSYNIGDGGSSQSDGGATTFDTYSSIAGTASEMGYTDQLTGTTYAKPGETGRSGADGGQGGTGADESLWSKGGDSVGGYVGGNGGYNRWDKDNTSTFSGGGGGGGAAIGNHGGDGGDADLEWLDHISGGGAGWFAQGGAGGAGGAGTSVGVPVPSGYGTGGTGGNGGGGGGSGGKARAADTFSSIGGKGGAGGPGGKGAPGCVIVYW